MGLSLLIICGLLAWPIAGFIPSGARPDIVDGPNRVSEGGERNSSRHITATIQTQTVELANISDAHPGDSSRSIPGWQREGLVGFGAGTVYMLDRLSQQPPSMRAN